MIFLFWCGYIKIFFLERRAKTKPKINTNAPKEQTLNPSKKPKITAKIGKE